MNLYILKHDMTSQDDSWHATLVRLKVKLYRRDPSTSSSRTAARADRHDDNGEPRRAHSYNAVDVASWPVANGEGRGIPPAYMRSNPGQARPNLYNLTIPPRLDPNEEARLRRSYAAMHTQPTIPEDGTESTDVYAAPADATEATECNWCGERATSANTLHPFQTSTCTHPADPPSCRTCIQTYLKQKATSEDWTRITCPTYQCSDIFQHVDMQRYASRVDLAQYELTLTNRAIGSDYVICAHNRCHGRGFCDPRVYSWFICPICQRDTCTDCAKVWHAGKTCDQQREEDDANTPGGVAQVRAARTARKREEDASARVVRRESVPCPNPTIVCPYWIQKNGGCDHLRCPQCGWEFCIRCMASWQQIRQHGNQAHRRDCPYHSSNV